MMEACATAATVIKRLLSKQSTKYDKDSHKVAGWFMRGEDKSEWKDIKSIFGMCYGINPMERKHINLKQLICSSRAIRG